MPGQKNRPFIFFCHRTSFSLFNHFSTPESRARGAQDGEQQGGQAAGEAAGERQAYSAPPKSQPLGCKHRPKCGESHFCFSRPAGWRRMIASRCTRVLMRKEFGLSWRLRDAPWAPRSISASLNSLQVLEAGVSQGCRAEPHHPGSAWRSCMVRASRRAEGKETACRARQAWLWRAPSYKDVRTWH